MNEKYKSILNMQHFKSEKHPEMPRADRAAQFAPFAALSGYGDAIAEEGRLTDRKIELDEYEAEIISDKLRMIAEGIKIPFHIIYFVKDKFKSGGKYEEYRGQVKRIDEEKRRLILNGGDVIPIDDIVNIEEIYDES